MAALIGLAVVVLAVVVLGGSGGTPSSGSGRSAGIGSAGSGAGAGRQSAGTSQAGGGSGTVTVKATAAASLPAPLSREGVVALPGGELLILGGLTSVDTSSAAVSILDPSRGSLNRVGSLVAPTHDAGTTLLGSQALMAGGGQATSVATVQAVPLPAAGAGSASAQATAVGQLPQVRSDDGAVTIGGVAYVVGGYDGSSPDPEVLSTSNGSSFTPVAALPVPVRYAGVVAVGGRIYVVGGEAVTGSSAGQPVNDVQVVNPARGTATVVAHLPEPVEGAAALDLGGTVVVAGGDVLGSGVGGAVTNATVWALDPHSLRITVAGQLPTPVAYAGSAVSGSTGWLVGGEDGGAVVASVVRLTLS